MTITARVRAAGGAETDVTLPDPVIKPKPQPTGYPPPVFERLQQISAPVTTAIGPDRNVDNWSIAFELKTNQAWVGWLGLAGRGTPHLDFTALNDGLIAAWLGGGNSVMSGRGVINPGTTYHVCYTHTGGTAANAITRIYVNAIERASGSPGATTPAVNWGHQWMVGQIIGNIPIGPSPQVAHIGNLRTWDVTLTPAQVAAVAGKIPDPDPDPEPDPDPGGLTDSVFPFLKTAARRFGWGKPTFEDEFTVNPKNNTGVWHVYNGAGHAGNGTRTPNQVFQDPANGGVMTIIGTPQGASAGMALRVPAGGHKYGRWEVAMKTAAGSINYHPLILMWPDPDTNFPRGGEIDYIEIFNSADRTEVQHFKHHGSSTNQYLGYETGHPAGWFYTDAKQWHAWALEWTSTKIRAFCDGVQYVEWNNVATFPPGPMHLCLQLDNFSNRGPITQGGRQDFAWVRQWT